MLLIGSRRTTCTMARIKFDAKRLVKQLCSK